MKIGANLKRIREDNRLSQQEIAEFLDISQKTYSNIESDKSMPTLFQLSKLSELLDFDLLEFLQEQGIVFNQKNVKVENIDNVHNNLSKILITQYELRIKEKEKVINLLKEKIERLEKG